MLYFSGSSVFEPFYLLLPLLVPPRQLLLSYRVRVLTLVKPILESASCQFALANVISEAGESLLLILIQGCRYVAIDGTLGLLVVLVEHLIPLVLGDGLPLVHIFPCVAIAYGPSARIVLFIVVGVFFEPFEVFDQILSALSS